MEDRSEKKMCEMSGYGLPEGTEAEEKKKANTEYGKARDRLRAIPSEMEVLLFLHDQGKIIDAISLEEYTLWANKYNGVDVFFEERERPERGKVYCGIVDVKNVKLGRYGTDYDNLYLEIKDGNLPGWAEREYATEYIDGKEIVKPNRFLAYVRGGKAFDGMMADQMPIYSDSKSERENTRDIVKYCFENHIILNHDVYIVSGNDVNKWIMEEVPERQRKGIQANNELSPRIPNWEKAYPLMRVKRTEDGWNIQQTGKGNMILQAKAKDPGHYEETNGVYQWVDYPIDEWEKGNSHVGEFEEDQKRGLSLLTCMYAKGLNVKTCLKGIDEINVNNKEYIEKIRKELLNRRIGKVWTE